MIMGTPPMPSGSNSSDYFGPDDPDFLDALQTAVLPGDIIGSSTSQAPVDVDELDVESDLLPPPCSQPSLKRPYLTFQESESQHSTSHQLTQDDTYGPSHFGQMGEYMRRKRAKLQIQNAELNGPTEGTSEKKRIFSGLAIYINGWTEPSVQDLRKLIIQHGGIFHAYLDRKALVTHIITCSLTPAKIREFKRMKVVRPEWLVDSVKAGVLLPWKNFIFRPGGRSEDSQGTKIAQTTLFDGISASTRSRKSESHPADPDSSMEVVSDSVGSFDMDEDPLPELDLQHSMSSPGKASSSPKAATASSLVNLPTPVNPTYATGSKSATEGAGVPGYAAQDSSIEVVYDSAESLDIDEDPFPELDIQLSMPPPRQVPASPQAASSSSSAAAHVDPLPVTDPKNAAEAALVPRYAGHKSNPNAERVMANPEWRAAHTSIAPDFIEGYYKHSRLHHLSTWKTELRNLVQEAQERAEGAIGKSSDGVAGKVESENVGRETADGVSMRGAELVVRSPKAKGKAKAVQDEQVIMHCDFDCFFVSAGLVDRPNFRGKPVVVCHSQGAQGGASSTSEIASASYEARKFGIKNGMSLQQARKLCPTILTIPYEFERYKQFSLQFYTILMSHADDLQAVSVDEALIDVTSSVARLRSHVSSPDPAKDFAEALRAQVKKSTGCEVSIGISHNILLARLATRRAKPAGSYHLLHEAVPEFLAPLDIRDLHGFGSSTKQKALEKLGATTLGELAKKSKGTLCEALGKGTGETLYNAIRGIDDKKLESDKPRKSVSSEINYGIRFESNEQAEAFIYQMAEEVGRRLNTLNMVGRSITLKIMKRDPTAPVEPPKFLGHGACDLFNKQMPLVGPGGRATNDDRVIGEHAWRLLKSFNFDPRELRGLGIQIQKLESTSAISNPASGQEKLSFKPVESPTKARRHRAEPTEELQIVIQPPSQGDEGPGGAVQVANDPGPSSVSNALELPSFSQVDMSVFDALPDDVRQELEAEYKRRSVSPFPVAPAPVPAPARLSEPPAESRDKITVKGVNVKRITKQLAPRNRPSISPKKSNLFLLKEKAPSSLRISDDELRELDIDPEIFAILSVDLQREQLILARHVKATGKVPDAPKERKVIKPFFRRSSVVIQRRPPPKANYPQPPFLKQKGPGKGEKLYFTETEDVQRVLEAWVNGFRQNPPKQKDVDYFARFLVQSVDGLRYTDACIEKAVAVAKWWLILLRRYWGAWEHAEADGAKEGGRGGSAMTPEIVGKAWWKAFREVKEQMDAVVRKRFGGGLALT